MSSNEKEDITRDPIEIKRIIKKYYEQRYIHQFDKLDEMEQFLERHNLTDNKQISGCVESGRER